jgi:hypothetical protein
MGRVAVKYFGNAAQSGLPEVPAKKVPEMFP